MIKPNVSIFGEITLRVVCDEVDPLRLQEVARNLLDLFYSATNDRIRSEVLYLLYHLVKNPNLAPPDLYQVCASSPYVGVQAIHERPNDAQLAEVYWQIHSDQVVNENGAFNAPNLNGFFKSHAIPNHVLLDLVRRLKAHADNGRHLLTIVRDHRPSAEVHAAILETGWLPERLRRKIENEIVRQGV